MGKKKPDESRWIEFFKSLLWPFIITFILCYIGIGHIYYMHSLEKFNDIFGTEINKYFLAEYSRPEDSSTKGGSDKFTCSYKKSDNKNVNIDFKSFPYFMPKKENEKTLANWFARNIGRLTSFNNNIKKGIYQELNKNKESSFFNLLILIAGVIITGFHFVLDFVTSLYSLFSYWFTDKPADISKVKLFIVILFSIILVIPAVSFTCSLLYYPLRTLYLTLLEPIITDPEMVIDIVKCNITPIAYLLTLIMVVSGWKHLSVIVAAIMTIVWLGMLISDLTTFANITLNKSKSN